MDDKTKGIGVERTSGRSDEYISGREALDTDGRIGERGTSRIPSRSTTTGTPGAGASSDTTHDPSLDRETEERAREIRAEIEQTRGEMSDTVNAIQDRLRPGNIASNAADSVKNTVKNAAGGTAQVVTDKARDLADRARDLGETEPVRYARSNPIPTAMIGVGIAGITWLALGGRESRSRNWSGRGRSGRDWRRVAPYDERDRYYRGTGGYTSYPGQTGYTAESSFGDAGFGEAEYPGQGGYATASGYRSDLYDNRGEYSGERGSYGGNRERGSWTGESGSGMMGSAQNLGRRAQQSTAGAQRKVQRAWRENPLMMGAASAVLGLIVGLAVPETEIENEYMGEARDSAIEGVQQSVRDTVHRVQDAASSAVGLVTGSNPQQSGNQQQRGQASGTQPRQASGNPSNQPAAGPSTTAPGTQSNQPDTQANRTGQAGGQGQTSRGTGQPPKTTGNI